MRICGILWVLSILIVNIASAGNSIVSKISFSGNKAFSTEDLKKVMNLKEGMEYDEYTINQDLNNIIKLYKRKGYIEAEIVDKQLSFDPVSQTIEYLFIISEGERVKVGEVKVVGVETISEEKILKLIGIKKGEQFESPKLTVSEYKIASLYSNMGYLYCTVKNEVLTIEKEAFITFKIEEGPIVEIGKIKIEGNKITRNEIIERELTIKEGDTYIPEKVYESQKKIYGTNLFKDVDFESRGIEERKEVVDIVFIVEEVSPIWMAVGAGYQSPDRASLDIEVGHDNLFNNGQKASLSSSFFYGFKNVDGEMKNEDGEEIGLDYLEPYFLGSKFKFMLHLFYERDRLYSTDKNMYTTQIEKGANAKIGRYIGKELQSYLQYQYKAASVDTGGEITGITNSLLFSISRDQRDNVFDPHRGSYTSLSLEYAGGILSGNNHFKRAITDISLFIHPFKFLVVAMRVKGGWLSPFGKSKSKGVSGSEKFELGGSGSIRGFDEASLGVYDERGRRSGNIVLNGNLELRFTLFEVKKFPVGIAIFNDSGGIWEKEDEVKLDDIKSGAGVGIRVGTPIGPARVDCAMEAKQWATGGRAKLYFAIGHIF